MSPRRSGIRIRRRVSTTTSCACRTGTRKLTTARPGSDGVLDTPRLIGIVAEAECGHHLAAGGQRAATAAGGNMDCAGRDGRAPALTAMQPKQDLVCHTSRPSPAPPRDRRPDPVAVPDRLRRLAIAGRRPLRPPTPPSTSTAASSTLHQRAPAPRIPRLSSDAGRSLCADGLAEGVLPEQRIIAGDFSATLIRIPRARR